MKKITITQIALAGVLAAAVFVASEFQIKLPVALGEFSRIHLGNAMCLLAGFLLGPVLGGLAAGIGSAIYDILDPMYITSAPFTFVFKFLMAFVCGLIAMNKSGAKLKLQGNARNIVAAILGAITYMILYLGKGFIKGMIVQNLTVTAALAATATKVPMSTFNAVVGVIVSVLLAAALKPALNKINSISC